MTEEPNEFEKLREETGVTFTRREVLSVGFFGAVGGYIYLLNPQEQTPYDDAKTYAPNDAQAHFIQQVSNNCEYLCFGDTNHSIGDIKLFLYSPRMTSVLKETGRLVWGIEEPDNLQSIYDTSKKSSRQEFQEQCEAKVTSDWLCSPEMKQNICARKFNVLAGEDMSFLTLDKRHLPENNFIKKMSWSQSVSMIPLGASLLAQDSIYGCMDITAFGHLPSALIAYFGGGSKEFMSQIANDKILYDTIKGQNQSLALVYGAGHLTSEEDNNLYDYMKRNNESFYVLNIFRDEEQRKQTAEQFEYLKADADIIVHPSVDHPSGIHVHNPALKGFLPKSLTSRVTRRNMFGLS